MEKLHDDLEDAWDRVNALRREGRELVVVTVTSVRGSTPAVLGAKAVVTREGRVSGTLGGGKVEAKAIGEAIGMLDGGEACRTRIWNLRQDVGMTCGGEVGFLFERVAAEPGWHVVVFGAGHVARALVPLLATMRCRVEVVDVRAEWLEGIEEGGNVNKRRVGDYVEGIERVTGRSQVVSITQGHATDRPVLRELLRRFPDIPFVGVIGSAAKRAVLMRELREDGLEESLLEKIVCPVGLPIGGNDPAEIALSIAAQLLECRGQEKVSTRAIYLE